MLYKPSNCTLQPRLNIEHVVAMLTMTIRAFIDINLDDIELEQLANPPLPLFLSIEGLLKSPPVKRSIKHKPLNRFLIYRRNYAASFPPNTKPTLKNYQRCFGTMDV